MHGAGVVFVLVAAAFVVRTVLVWFLRPAHPSAAAFVNRWWVWLPLATIAVGVTWWQPVVGVVLTGVTLTLMYRDPNVDMPFRGRGSPT